MPSKSQLDFFQQVYTDETSRGGTITKRAEIYLSIISLLLTGFIFKLTELSILIKNFRGYEHQIIIILFAFIFISIFSSACLIIHTLIPKRYIATTAIQDWQTEVKKSTADEDFYTNRIAEFIVAIPVNREINNERSRNLTLAAYFLLSSIIFIGCFIFLIIAL